MTHPSVTIQITPASALSVPTFLGEVATLAQVLSHVRVLTAILEQVRFARARFGTYELIDFVAVLIGYNVRCRRWSHCPLLIVVPCAIGWLVW